MRDATQRGLDATQHDGRIGKGLAAALGIDDNGAVGPPAALAVRRVAVVVPEPPVGGVAVHHRVHVARGDAEEQVGLAQCPEGGGIAPLRLGDDAHPEALRLQQPGHQSHAETGMVDVGVTRYQDDVAAVPPQLVHLLPRHGKERRCAKALRPILPIGEQRLRRRQGRGRRGSDEAGGGHDGYGHKAR